jgi:uncharacterized protein with PhoU and TrkA domain
VRESDEVITKLRVDGCSPIIGKTFRELKLGTETGIHIMAVKRAERWVYSPSARTKVQEGDILIGRGSHTSEEALLEMCACPTREDN